MTTKPLLIFFVVWTFILAGCAEDPSPPQKAAPKPAAAPQPQPPQAAAQPATWPYLSDLSEDHPVGDLAEDLTARNYFLIFDGSGSMRDSECSGSSQKIEVAKKAVTAWSKSVPANANLGLYAFHNQGLLTLPLATGNRDAFIRTVDKVQAGGKTPLSDAMIYAYKAFTDQGRRQLGYGEYTIVVVTDGIANSIPRLQQVVDQIIAKTPINIYSIGFCIGEQHSLNQPGRTLYKSADNPEQLQKGLQEVLAESESFDEDEFSQ